MILIRCYYLVSKNLIEQQKLKIFSSSLQTQRVIHFWHPSERSNHCLCVCLSVCLTVYDSVCRNLYLSCFQTLYCCLIFFVFITACSWGCFSLFAVLQYLCVFVLLSVWLFVFLPHACVATHLFVIESFWQAVSQKVPNF